MSHLQSNLVVSIFISKLYNIMVRFLLNPIFKLLGYSVIGPFERLEGGALAARSRPACVSDGKPEKLLLIATVYMRLDRGSLCVKKCCPMHDQAAVLARLKEEGKQKKWQEKIKDDDDCRTISCKGQRETGCFAFQVVEFRICPRKKVFRRSMLDRCFDNEMLCRIAVSSC